MILYQDLTCPKEYQDAKNLFKKELRDACFSLNGCHISIHFHHSRHDPTLLKKVKDWNREKKFNPTPPLTFQVLEIYLIFPIE
ncbi:MAG: hypothetical protein ACTSXU_07040 [Promethearchaeota archaeon]